MFDQKFFTGSFAESAREFLTEHGGLAVEFVTAGGERLDVIEIQALESEGMTLVTRSERLVFLPYDQVEYVELSGQRDHRITSFRLPASSA